VRRLESRSSGGGHRSRLRTFRTPPAVEAHVQLDDPSGEQIDGFLNSKSPLVVYAPHDVFTMHTPRVRQSPPVAYRRDRQCAQIGHWVYPYEYVFPNSEISPGGLHSRSDLDEALGLGLALPIVFTS
jgi:hypothetical protein